jgi:hypothetical protein
MMKSEYKRVVTQASEEMLARWILKNLDWTGGNDDNNGAFLTSILQEHRRQCFSGPEEHYPFLAIGFINNDGGITWEPGREPRPEQGGKLVYIAVSLDATLEKT